jgi:hypothetical protein
MECCKAFKILDSIVELVSVDVVDLHSCWNCSVNRPPNNDVFHSLAFLRLVPNSPVSFRCNVSISTNSVANFSEFIVLFSHDCKDTTTSFMLSSPKSRSFLEALGQ